MKSTYKKKSKKKSLAFYKKKAWKIFSEYIRRKYANKKGMVKCVTCGTIKHWKKMQASHLIQGRMLNILFDERGVYPCCYQCNVAKNGNIVEYIFFLKQKHGNDLTDKIINDLRTKSKIPIKYTIEDYKILINKYETYLKMLSNA